MVFPSVIMRVILARLAASFVECPQLPHGIAAIGILHPLFVTPDGTVSDTKLFSDLFVG